MRPDSLRDLRRAQIITTARAIVAAEGTEALTIGALESRLAFSRGVITYHFENKDEIVRAALESAVQEIDAATYAEVEASLSSEEKIRAVIRANVRGFVGRVEAGRVLLSFWGRLSSDERIAALNARLYATYRGRVRRLIEEGVASGAFAPVDASAVASTVVGLVLGIALQWYFEPNGIDVERAIEEGAESVLARLRGASPGRAPAIK